MAHDERREVLRAALRATGWNVRNAAKALGVHRQLFWYHMRATGIGHEPAVMRRARRRRFVLPLPSAA